MLKYVDHIDLKVKEFKATVAMFREMGFGIRREMPERGSVEMALPGEHQVVFEIHRAKEGGFEGIHHIAFKSEEAPGEDDVAAIRERCGVEFLTERSVIKHTGRTVSSFKDVNGLTWQLTD